MLEVYRIHFDTLDSTINWIKSHFDELEKGKLTCVTASTQTKGRGRFSRTWISEKGNLHMSLFFPVTDHNHLIPNLSQIMALALFYELNSLGIMPQIKWPNDLIYKEKKLAGILTEIISQNEQAFAILSVGLNVNAEVETNQKTTSLREVTGKEWDLSEIRNSIIERFQKELEKGFSARDFQDLLAFRGELISCMIGNKKVEGTLIGIDEQGHLQIGLSDGSIESLPSGEIQKMRAE